MAVDHDTFIYKYARKEYLNDGLHNLSDQGAQINGNGRMEFEWDRDKGELNLKKHGISFREAATVFGDTLAITFDDPDHSVGEYRLITFGLSRFNQQLVVSHTEREGKMRIISARPMKRKERKIYEEG